MKKFLIFSLTILVLLSSCSVGRAQTKVPAAKTDVPVTVPTLIPTSTDLPSTPTVVPTVTSTKVPDQRKTQIEKIQDEYGWRDEKYTSDRYFKLLDQDIARCGVAKRITVLEYHGDNYSMYDTQYSMTPESFEKQIRGMANQGIHFVTGPELYLFTYGMLELPACSVVITTDSSGGSMNSIPRMIAVAQKVESDTGRYVTYISLIWSYAMEPENTIRCKNDICWKSFEAYKASGFFTFGSHSERHADFSKFTREETEWDLSTNLSKIYNKLGLHAYIVAWPLEACSPYEDIVKKEGIKVAFGGWTRGTLQLYTYANDDMPLCLPRLFPPNPDGYSSRPVGLTWEDIINRAMNDFVPLHK